MVGEHTYGVTANLVCEAGAPVDIGAPSGTVVNVLHAAEEEVDALRSEWFRAILTDAGRLQGVPR